MKVLLDTCTFLWIALDAPDLSSRAREIFQEPGHQVFLSPVSAWEIAVKSALGRMPLPAPAESLIPELRRRHGIDSLPLEEEAVLQLGKLPDLHRDPFDRMLVCQGIVHGLVILTPDEDITRYPVRTAW